MLDQNKNCKDFQVMIKEVNHLVICNFHNLQFSRCITLKSNNLHHKIIDQHQKINH
jgi:hypothetical protein